MRTLRCAIYTRVSSEHGLEQEFNSLDNQREASEAYVKSQAHEGWRALSARYDDGGFSGASMDRPALQRLLADIRAGLITSTAQIALHQGCSERSVRITLSLAFLAPAMVKAAVDSRLPYGLTASSFSELPILWEEQLQIAS